AISPFEEFGLLALGSHSEDKHQIAGSHCIEWDLCLELSMIAKIKSQTRFVPMRNAAEVVARFAFEQRQVRLKQHRAASFARQQYLAMQRGAAEQSPECATHGRASRSRAGTIRALRTREGRR